VKTRTPSGKLPLAASPSFSKEFKAEAVELVRTSGQEVVSSSAWRMVGCRTNLWW
jgi:transposase-like protein